MLPVIGPAANADIAVSRPEAALVLRQGGVEPWNSQLQDTKWARGRARKDVVWRRWTDVEGWCRIVREVAAMMPPVLKRMKVSL